MSDQNTEPGAGVRTDNPRGDVGAVNQFYFAFIKDIRQFVIKDLRYHFGTSPRVKDKFRFVGKTPDAEVGIPELEGETDLKESKIRISGPYADGERLLPEVLVNKVSVNVNDLFLGQKMGSLYAKVKDPVLGTDYEREVGERRGGQLTAQVTLRAAVVGGGPIELDELCDALLYALVGPVRKRLQARRLVWVPNSGSLSQEQEDPYTNVNKLFSRLFAFSLIADWMDDFYFDGVEFGGTVDFISDKSG